MLLTGCRNHMPCLGNTYAACTDHSQIRGSAPEGQSPCRGFAPFRTSLVSVSQNLLLLTPYHPSQPRFLLFFLLLSWLWLLSQLLSNSLGHLDSFYFPRHWKPRCFYCCCKGRESFPSPVPQRSPFRRGLQLFPLHQMFSHLSFNSRPYLSLHCYHQIP